MYYYLLSVNMFLYAEEKSYINYYNTLHSSFEKALNELNLQLQTSAQGFEIKLSDLEAVWHDEDRISYFQYKEEAYIRVLELC